MMRGIVSWGAYLPYRRLDRAEITALVGHGGGRGTRTVAGFDEDATTMAVEASRLALRATEATPDTVLFGSVVPAYADRTNATAVHAALHMAGTVRAFDLGLSTRSGVGGLLMALRGGGTTLVATADIRGGLAGSAEEANGGDAAGALVVGEHSPTTPLLAEVVATASATAEFVDRWRTPGDTRSKVWDEKFAEVTYLPLGRTAWNQALAEAGLEPAQVSAVVVAAPTARIATATGARLGAASVVDGLSATIGQTGAAQPAVSLVALLEQARPGDVVALVSLADGADVVVLRCTAAIEEFRPARTLAEQLAHGAPVSYAKFLSWRGTLAVEPPRRPEPPRVSSTAAARSSTWKFALVGTRDRESGTVHLPPSRVSTDGVRTDDMVAHPMADLRGTVATFTVDRVAYSPSPPIVFAVVDFDGGGRLPVELTDCDADEVAIGARVEMTFRRLYTADGIPDYFWKGRLVRG
jgi:hydroxymethylglutaryl-CoA synthase